MDDNLWAVLILIIIVPLAFVALAIVLDKRSRGATHSGRSPSERSSSISGPLALSTGRKTWGTHGSPLSSSSADSLSR